MAWKDCLQGQEMRNIHSHKKSKREREGWQSLERRERENGRKTRGEKMAADSGQSDRREERGR